MTAEFSKDNVAISDRIVYVGQVAFRAVCWVILGVRFLQAHRPSWRSTSGAHESQAKLTSGAFTFNHGGRGAPGMQWRPPSSSSSSSCCPSFSSPPSTSQTQPPFASSSPSLGAASRRSWAPPSVGGGRGASVTSCRLPGVACAWRLGGALRAVSMSLPFCGLNGSLSPAIGRLSALWGLSLPGKPSLRRDTPGDSRLPASADPQPQPQRVVRAGAPRNLYPFRPPRSGYLRQQD